MECERKREDTSSNTPGRRCVTTTAGIYRVLSRLNYPVTASRDRSRDPDLGVCGGERRDPQKLMSFAHRPLGVDRSMDRQGSKKQGATEVGHPHERNEKAQPTHVVSVVGQSCPGRTCRRHRLPLIVLWHPVSPIPLPPSQIPECPECKYEERHNTSHHTCA